MPDEIPDDAPLDEADATDAGDRPADPAPDEEDVEA